RLRTRFFWEMLYRFFNGSVRCVGRKKVDLCSARALRSLRLFDAECNNQPQDTQECRGDQSIAEPGNDPVCRRCRTHPPDWYRIKSGGDSQQHRQSQGETHTLRSGDQPRSKTFLPGPGAGQRSDVKSRKTNARTKRPETHAWRYAEII